jgi:hypothetical protein
MVKEDSVMENIKLKVFHNNGEFVTFISAEDDEATVSHIISDKVGVISNNYITVPEDNIPLPWQLSIVDNEVSVLDGVQLATAEANEKDKELLNEVRLLRNRKLAETDWWASSDITMTTQQASYRQALRDITIGATSISDAVFPTKPTGE